MANLPTGYGQRGLGAPFLLFVIMWEKSRLSVDFYETDFKSEKMTFSGRKDPGRGLSGP